MSNEATISLTVIQKQLAAVLKTHQPTIRKYETASKEMPETEIAPIRHQEGRIARTYATISELILSKSTGNNFSAESVNVSALANATAERKAKELKQIESAITEAIEANLFPENRKKAVEPLQIQRAEFAACMEMIEEALKNAADEAGCGNTFKSALEKATKELAANSR